MTRDKQRFLTCRLDPKKDGTNLCRALEHPELIDDPRFSAPELRRAKWTGVEKVKPSRAPEVGEHTVEVLKSIGYGGEAIHDLLQSGAALDGR